MWYIKVFLITLASAQVYIPNFDKLHSYPSSSRKICISFRAYNYVNSPWIFNSTPAVPSNAPWVINNSTIPIPNFDIDGDPTTFSNTEQAIIVSTWAMVSELFIPFDIDVTTECTKDDVTRYDTSDLTYGCKAQLTNYANVFGTVDPYSFKIGGISRIGSFGELSSNESNVWIFTDYERGGPIPLVLASTIAHECGHTFGLTHDGVNNVSLPYVDQVYFKGQGTGMTEWSAIMGGVFYNNNTKIRTRSMWNNGDYYQATNQQDDLFIISNKTYYRPDDVNNTCGSSMPLQLNSQNYTSFSGVIEKSTDTDKFNIYLTAGVPVYFSVSVTPFQSPITDMVNAYITPFLTQPNAMGVTGISSFQNPPIDIKLEIWAPNCSLFFVTMNPPDDLSIPKFGYTPIMTAKHYIFISSVAKGSPLIDGYSIYGSIGGYNLNVDYNQTIVTTPIVITTTPQPVQPTQPDPIPQPITPPQQTDSTTPVVIAVLVVLGIFVFILCFRHHVPHKHQQVQYRTHLQSGIIFKMPRYDMVQQDIVSTL